MRTFLHITGTLTGTSERLPSLAQTLDVWIPAKAPEGAKLLGTHEMLPPEEVVRGAYKLEKRIGFAKITLGVNLWFGGKLEIWGKE